jgi:hypothetical protein
MLKTILLVATCFFALSARASYSITINGTINSNSTASGYSVGDAFSITITFTSSFVTSAGNNFDSSTRSSDTSRTYNNWWYTTSPYTVLTESLSFTGSTGTYVTNYDEFWFVNNSTYGLYTMLTSSCDSSSSTLAAGSLAVTQYMINVKFTGVDTLTGLGTESDFYEFLTTNAGTYTASNISDPEILINLGDNTGDPLISFTPTSLIITASVPEPSTGAALAGLAALGAVAFFRRKRK